MAYPNINREVKCAFRWYRAQRLLHRFRTATVHAGEPETSIPSLPFPHGTILPFQIVCDQGTTLVLTWKLYDLAGTMVLDLASHIPDLVYADYGSPDRSIICLQEQIIDLALPEGVFEMRITTNMGETLYSETFELLCGKEFKLENSDVVDGFTHWSYGNWPNVVNDVVRNNSELPISGMQVFDDYVSIEDSLIYAWNGTSYDANTPSDNTFWTKGPGFPWYRFFSGAWEVDVVGPVAPISGEGSAACWDGRIGVPWVYTPPANSLPTFVRLEFTVFHGGGFAGTVQLFVGPNFIAEYTNADNGNGQDVTVYMEAGDAIEFYPSDDFTGCIVGTNFYAVADGTECMTRLEWFNCGDIGTTAYTIGEGLFKNVLFLREGTGPIAGAVWEPTPLVTVENETKKNGSAVQMRSRKEVDWKLQYDNMPWHVIDALSEIPTVSDRTIRVPWAGEPDAMMLVRIDTQWASMLLVAQGTMTFQVDEATSGSGCCDLFLRPCASACVAADGIFGTDELVVGNTYLYNNGTYAVYCSLDCVERVDEEGFNNIQPCLSRFATVAGVSYRWDGTLWTPVVTIDSITQGTPTCEELTIVATIQSGYTGRFQYSIDGSVWTNIGPGYSAAELADGQVIIVPTGTQYIRLEVVGAEECLLVIGPATPSPCICPVFIITTNLDSLCGSLPNDVTILVQPYASEGGPVLAMVASGEVVTIEYRINGGAWTFGDVETTGAFFAVSGVPYTTAGDVLEVRVTPTDRGWCAPTVSDPFSCPA